MTARLAAHFTAESLFSIHAQILHSITLLQFIRYAGKPSVGAYQISYHTELQAFTIISIYAYYMSDSFSIMQPTFCLVGAANT